MKLTIVKPSRASELLRSLPEDVIPGVRDRFLELYALRLEISMSRGEKFFTWSKFVQVGENEWECFFSSDEKYSPVENFRVYEIMGEWCVSIN